MRKPLFDQNGIMGLFSDFRAAQINERKCAKTGAQRMDILYLAQFNFFEWLGDNAGFFFCLFIPMPL